jgi:hypothetical protein
MRVPAVLRTAGESRILQSLRDALKILSFERLVTSLVASLFLKEG